MIGASEPASTKTIWATETHSLENGDGNIRIVLEYGLIGKWAIVDAAVKTEFASKRLTRFVDPAVEIVASTPVTGIARGRSKLMVAVQRTLMPQR